MLCIRHPQLQQQQALLHRWARKQILNSAAHETHGVIEATERAYCYCIIFIMRMKHAHAMQIRRPWSKSPTYMHPTTLESEPEFIMKQSIEHPVGVYRQAKPAAKSSMHTSPQVEKRISCKHAPNIIVKQPVGSAQGEEAITQQSQAPAESDRRKRCMIRTRTKHDG